MPLLRVYLTSPIASCVCSLIDNSREPIRNEYSHFLLQKVCFLRREYADARVTAEVTRTVVINNRTIPWCNLFINSLFTRCRSSVWYRPRTFFPIETAVKTTLTQQGEHQVQTCTEQECNVQGKKKIEMRKWVFCFSCPTFNSSCPLGKLERTARTSVFYGLSRKMCERIMS